MKRTDVALTLALVLLLGCTGGKRTDVVASDEPEEEVPLPERFDNDDLPKAADELFEDFMYYFASNERLQRRRIAFPVKCDTGIVAESDWQMDPFFTSMGEYTLIFDSQEQREQVNDTAIDRVVVEKIFFNADSVRQYDFNRNDGRWMLTTINAQPLDANPNAAFLRFYKQFAGDSTFQKKSLASEIAFTGPDPEDDFSQMEGFITPDFWEAFAPELPHDSIYNIVYGKQNAASKQKLFVICGISNGQETELTFERRRGRWKLSRLCQ